MKLSVLIPVYNEEKSIKKTPPPQSLSIKCLVIFKLVIQE